MHEGRVVHAFEDWDGRMLLGRLVAATCIAELYVCPMLVRNGDTQARRRSAVRARAFSGSGSPQCSGFVQLHG